ncbi:hypothetical protein NL676_001352 [Syzygium grande]|nr:hypothetical protein NL676_001352 [Syzygium grande]
MFTSSHALFSIEMILEYLGDLVVLDKAMLQQRPARLCPRASGYGAQTYFNSIGLEPNAMPIPSSTSTPRKTSRFQNQPPSRGHRTAPCRCCLRGSAQPHQVGATVALEGEKDGEVRVYTGDP